jgi:hypothetical protein
MIQPPFLFSQPSVIGERIMAVKKQTKAAPKKAPAKAEKPSKPAPSKPSKPEKPSKPTPAGGSDDVRSLFRKATKGLDGKWKKAQAGMGFEDDVIPTGDYVARLNSCRVGVWQSDGSPWIKFRWVIANGEQQGKKITAQDNLIRDGEPNEIALSIIKGNLDKLGYSVDDLSIEDMPDVAEQLSNDKPAARVHVKATKGSQGDRTFYSVYVNRLIESEEVEDEDEEGDEDEE